MLTPLALFIQLGQLAIILPQRNQTAFITTVWSHLLLTSWIAVIEESKVLVFYAVWLHFSSDCVMTTKHNCDQSCRFFRSHEWTRLQIYQLRISWQPPSWLLTTSIMPLSWKHMEASCLKTQSSETAIHQAAFLLTISSGFINHNWAVTSRVMSWILHRTKSTTFLLHYKTHGRLQFNTSRCWNVTATHLTDC